MGVWVPDIQFLVYPESAKKMGWKKVFPIFSPNFCCIWWIFFSKFCCTLCSKCGFRVAFPTRVNINVNLYLVWKVVENVHFYVNFSKQKNLDLIYWYMKRSENSQQFWLKNYFDSHGNWTHLILLLVFSILQWLPFKNNCNFSFSTMYNAL